jgi:uncharacterized protein (DUF433 family)
MAAQIHRIVPGEESDIHDEPHIQGSRITVRSIHDRVENSGVNPKTIADRHSLDLVDVYHALAYYHEHPEEMRSVEQQRERVVDAHREEAITGPADLE